MPSFELIDTALSGLKIMQRKAKNDARGFFSRFYCIDELSIAGFDEPISQINQTLTKEKGTVRGMHYQNPPYSEIKIVSCTKGKVFDVAVDLRKGSPTFLHWHAEVLSAENLKGLLIPKGFAHGFQALTDECELIYLHSHPYVKESEGGLNVNDEKLGISWPLAINDLSERDRMQTMIKKDFKGLVV